MDTLKELEDTSRTKVIKFWESALPQQAPASLADAMEDFHSPRIAVEHRHTPNLEKQKRLQPAAEADSTS
jgi:hypothetical protein